MTDPDRMWIAGMPDELIATIAELSVVRQRAAAAGWSASGAGARHLYCDYINRGRFGWTRRMRSVRVARGLTKVARTSAP